MLANAFIVPENKGLVFLNGPAQRTSILMATEGWNRAYVEVVLGIQRSVPHKLVSAAVNLIGARARDRADHAPGSSSVLGYWIGCNYGELLDRVHAQISTQHAARTGVGVVIYIDSVQKVAILLGTASRDTQLRSQPTLRAVTGSH